MKIRAARESDAENIYLTHKASIEALCAGYYSEQEIAGWIDVLSPSIYENAIHEKVMIVAEEGDEVAGLGILDEGNREIGAIYVHPGSIGMGLGQRILDELERRAHKKGIDCLTLCSTTNALGFYEHHGYHKEGQSFHELPNGVTLECIHMRKILPKR
jgi:ribosomal protein S18 acetylase RimI-like enzyme